MTNPAQPLPDPADPGDALARRPDQLPILPAKDSSVPPDTQLRYVEAPQPAGKKSRDPVLRGLKDLHQLQKQTIAVLETLKGSLDDIHQVLRSPEATRGVEKQKNAATLLSKGFAHEAAQQAADAAQLLPANPEAQLLLALSLAADQQFDSAIAATRKGLALIDRRTHPLAIEAGLLHALASLGCVPEALERWAAIIDTLPLPVLLEQIPRIAACYPNTQDLPAGEALDNRLALRIARNRIRAQAAPAESPAAARRALLIDTRPSQIPAAALLAGIDASGHLAHTRRAVMLLIAQRLNAQKNPADIVKFITDCLIPLGNRNLRITSSLGRTAVKRLFRFHADASTLHRAMVKLEMSGSQTATRQLAELLEHWRTIAQKTEAARQMLTTSLMFILTGAGVLAYVLFIVGTVHGKQAAMAVAPGIHINALYAGPALIAIGIVLALARLLRRSWPVQLPNERPPLSPEELRFLRTPAVRQSLRNLAHPNP